jgi:hypothetical protein
MNPFWSAAAAGPAVKAAQMRQDQSYKRGQSCLTYRMR